MSELVSLSETVKMIVQVPEDEQAELAKKVKEAMESGKVEEPKPEVRPFYGSEGKDPQYLLKEEKPHHRHLLNLAAAGATRKEIVEETGFSPFTVAYTLKQDWARKAIAEEMQQAVRQTVMTELKGAAMIAVKTLIEAADLDSVKVPKARIESRIKAADSILNRLGIIAPTVVKHEHKDVTEMSDGELEEVLKNREN